MLNKTRGIVLSHIKYSDSSIIAHIYTEEFGRLAIMVKGVRSRRAPGKISIFQPLFLVEMEIYHKSRREIQTLKEIHNHKPFTSIPYDIRKSTIALFLGELLYKTLKEEEANPKLFDFLINTIQWFDLMEEGVSSFHLCFLSELTKYLGFYPDSNNGERCPYFDLQNGVFVGVKPIHPNHLSGDRTFQFHRLLKSTLQNFEEPGWSREVRTSLLDDMIEYYRLQIEALGIIKSIQVLKEVFH